MEKNTNEIITNKLGSLEGTKELAQLVLAVARIGFAYLEEDKDDSYTEFGGERMTVDGARNRLHGVIFACRIMSGDPRAVAALSEMVDRGRDRLNQAHQTVRDLAIFEPFREV